MICDNFYPRSDVGSKYKAYYLLRWVWLVMSSLLTTSSTTRQTIRAVRGSTAGVTVLAAPRTLRATRTSTVSLASPSVSTAVTAATAAVPSFSSSAASLRHVSGRVVSVLKEGVKHYKDGNNTLQR